MKRENLCSLSSVLRHDNTDSWPTQTLFFTEKLSFILNTRTMKASYSYTMLKNVLKTIQTAYGLFVYLQSVFMWVSPEFESWPHFPHISGRVVSNEVIYECQHLLVPRQSPAQNKDIGFWYKLRWHHGLPSIALHFITNGIFFTFLRCWSLWGLACLYCY